jgi:hypothetical protein
MQSPEGKVVIALAIGGTQSTTGPISWIFSVSGQATAVL